MSEALCSVRLIFPHQLFIDHFDADKNTIMVLVEDDLFFKQYPFHKQKLILHRASMRSFVQSLEAKKYTVITIESSSKKSMDVLSETLVNLKAKKIAYYDLVDDWLEQSVDMLINSLGLRAERLVSPGFLTSRGLIDEYFENNQNRMQYFYEWQRKRLNILMDGAKPKGGKYSFDADNRKKLPKTVQLPPVYEKINDKHITDAQKWVVAHFADNPGNADTFAYPVTHAQAAKQLSQFITQRLALFGPYEDAIAQHQSQLFHSVLSSSLNCGLLTPKQVVDEVLNYANHHDVPIESLEGFIRQIIGWREYIRATYVRYGRTMRTTNYLDFDRSLHKSWWTGTVGIKPIDVTIQRTLDTAYAHHIERLMILGNCMVLLRISPDYVYEWFMSLFIDAYDWVMVPNVYAMSQFAAGDMITTKPYISGSNYIIKMSDYKKDAWSEVWDALYWQFVAEHRDMIEKNYRMKMVVSIYDKFSAEKKHHIADVAQDWLK